VGAGVEVAADGAEAVGAGVEVAADGAEAEAAGAEAAADGAEEEAAEEDDEGAAGGAEDVEAARDAAVASGRESAASGNARNVSFPNRAARQHWACRSPGRSARSTSCSGNHRPVSHGCLRRVRYSRARGEQPRLDSQGRRCAEPSSAWEAEPATAAFVAAEQSNAVEAPTPRASRRRRASPRQRRPRAHVASARTEYRGSSGRTLRFGAPLNGRRRPFNGASAAYKLRTAVT
jgi:hypothetical protein